MIFYWYPKCSTCQNAHKQLVAQGVELEVFDIVKETPSKEDLLKWFDMYGKGIKPFFNTSGMVYREMQLKDRINDLSNEEAATLLSQNGMLIKRPLLINNDQIIIGFKKEEYKKLG